MNPSSHRRLDTELLQRGLVRSRTAAARLIRTGAVRVDGTVILRPAQPVSADALLDLHDDGWVSRAAIKLEAALTAFDLTVSGRLALDAGASTGGFSQVLLARGARRVLSIDVGHGQLDPRIAEDPRVVAVEGLNVRFLDPAALLAATGERAAPEVVVADLSFISLRQVLPALAAVAAPDADLVLLVKPQFEVGRQRIRDGVVRDPELRRTAVEDVLGDAWRLGLGTAGLIESPVAGESGNREVLIRLSGPSGTHPAEWAERLQHLTAPIRRRSR